MERWLHWMRMGAGVKGKRWQCWRGVHDGLQRLRGVHRRTMNMHLIDVVEIWASRLMKSNPTRP